MSHPRSPASRGCGRSLLPVEVGIYVVVEAGADVCRVPTSEKREAVEVVRILSVTRRWETSTCRSSSASAEGRRAGRHDGQRVGKLESKHQLLFQSSGWYERHATHEAAYRELADRVREQRADTDTEFKMQEPR